MGTKPHTTPESTAAAGPVAPPPSATPRPTMRQKLQIALRGDVGLRTVDAYFQGRSQEATTRSRIERTLRELAMESFIRPPPAQAA